MIVSHVGVVARPGASPMLLALRDDQMGAVLTSQT